MLVTVEEKVSVKRRVQLTFDFAAPEETSRTRKKQTRLPKAKKQQKPQSVSAGADSADQQRITDICLLLHDLARKFVPSSAFRDYTTFMRCANVLSEAGVLRETPPELTAGAAEHDSALIVNAPQYRLLRNRAIAGLATVADLSGKAPAKGSHDYQRGMRDAYQHASEIAAMFLEDVQNGV